VAASRRPAAAAFAAGTGTLALDATDARAVRAALPEAAAVVSCIAGSAADILASGRLLLESVGRLASPPRVVYLSSMAAYGSARGVVDESAPLLGDLDDYSAAKAAIDRLAAEHPFAVRLRPGIIYGPFSPWWTERIGRLLLARRLGNLGAAGAGTCNLVHVEDVVTAVMRSLTLPEAAGRAFNLGSPAPPTWNEYFERYARALGVSSVPHISGNRLRLELGLYGPLLKLLEKALPHSRLARTHPALRPWLAALCRHDIRLAVQSAQQRLALTWRPLETGLEECARWLLRRAA